jgi:hypothetical protein
MREDLSIDLEQGIGQFGDGLLKLKLHAQPLIVALHLDVKPPIFIGKNGLVWHREFFQKL